MKFIFEFFEDSIFKFFSFLILLTLIFIFFLAYIDKKNYFDYEKKEDFISCLMENPRYICNKIIEEKEK